MPQSLPGNTPCTEQYIKKGRKHHTAHYDAGEKSYYGFLDLLKKQRHLGCDTACPSTRGICLEACIELICKTGKKRPVRFSHISAACNEKTCHGGNAQKYYTLQKHQWSIHLPPEPHEHNQQGAYALYHPHCRIRPSCAEGHYRTGNEDGSQICQGLCKNAAVQYAGSNPGHKEQHYGLHPRGCHWQQ